MRVRYRYGLYVEHVVDLTALNPGSWAGCKTIGTLPICWYRTFIMFNTDIHRLSWCTLVSPILMICFSVVKVHDLASCSENAYMGRNKSIFMRWSSLFKRIRNVYFSVELGLGTQKLILCNIDISYKYHGCVVIPTFAVVWAQMVQVLPVVLELHGSLQTWHDRSSPVYTPRICFT